MAKQYIDVLIDGKVYSLGGSETEGYVQQIATYLNGKIFQLKAQPGFLKMSLSPLMVSTLSLMAM